MKFCLIPLLWFLSACAYEYSTVTADENEIAIRTGIYANSAPAAQEHCAKYGKTAVLRDVAEEVYFYTCIPPK